MKDYKDLSRTAKLRRLHSLAVTALAQYDIKNPEIVFFGYETNLLFRVTLARGEHFMLRLATPGWRTYEDLRSEAWWLNALNQDTTLSVPKILPARSGETVLPLSSPAVPGIWNASLMSWVPGRLLGHYLTEPNLEKMGALFAGLHHHGAAWVPPSGFTTRRFEHWLSRGEENRITGGGQALSGEQAGKASALSVQSREMLDRIHIQVEKAYAAIDRSDLRIIHCDLWHNNIKLYRGVLHPLDFEDTVWGFRAHDIAMAMLDLLEDTDEARYPQLLAAFRRGYTANMPWPEDAIEPFQIGRMLWQINWVARYQPQRLGSVIERFTPVFEHYQQTGRVIFPPKA